MMTPTALSILMRTFREGAERNKAMGVWTAMGGMGATAAWLIGGPLVDGPGWQWVFWINIPIGVALFAAAYRLVPESRDLDAPRSFDIAGAGTITASLAVLIYDLVEAPSHGWGSTRTIVLFAASVLLFAAFVVIERNAKHPLIPRRLAASKTVWAANIGLGGVMASIYGMVFILALYGENVLHWSASHLGFAGTVLPFSAAGRRWCRADRRYQARPAGGDDLRGARVDRRLRAAQWSRDPRRLPRPVAPRLCAVRPGARRWGNRILDRDAVRGSSE